MLTRRAGSSVSASVSAGRSEVRWDMFLLTLDLFQQGAPLVGTVERACCDLPPCPVSMTDDAVIQALLAAIIVYVAVP